LLDSIRARNLSLQSITSTATTSSIPFYSVHLSFTLTYNLALAKMSSDSESDQVFEGVLFWLEGPFSGATVSKVRLAPHLSTTTAPLTCLRRAPPPQIKRLIVDNGGKVAKNLEQMPTHFLISPQIWCALPPPSVKPNTGASSFARSTGLAKSPLDRLACSRTSRLPTRRTRLRMIPTTR